MNAASPGAAGRRPFVSLREPIVQAPLAGGPSTVELAAAVCQAGGLGFLAAGYRPADAVAEDVRALRARVDGAFGVNLFVPSGSSADRRALDEYAERVRAVAERYGAEVGQPRHDDDDWTAKLDLIVAARVPIVSFTFGAPPAGVVDRLHQADVAVWVTVTELGEARRVAELGADALVVQGVEAGGHRGSFEDRDGAGEMGLLALLRLIERELDLPVVAAGGLADGAAVAAVLAAGASAAQLGTAFLLTPEAGTSAAHRNALGRPGVTGLTRAFSGRRARGIVNRFQAEHSRYAPSAYPEVHHLTSPLRAAARSRDDADLINLWAGEAFALAQARPAGELVAQLGRDARAALEQARARLR